MIIPALVRLYDRMLAEGDEGLAPPGYSRQQIGFRVVLEKDGTLFEIQPVVDLTAARHAGTGRGKARADAEPAGRPQRLLVPGQTKPSGSGINPCFLWDNAAYMLGLVPEGGKPDRVAACFEAFRGRHLALRDAIDDQGFDAVCDFLKAWRPSRAEKHREILTHFGVFQVRGEHRYVHERPKVERWWKEHGAAAAEGAEDEPDEEPRPRQSGKPPARGARAAQAVRDGRSTVPTGGAFSLVDGTPQRLARLHEPKIKGVAGAQSSGATIVSFNQDAFTSYAKDQGANAPVGVDEAFKYCTALNRLTSDSSRRVRLAGDTFVFWSEGAPKAEGAFFNFFGASVAGIDAAERAKQTFERAARGEADGDLGPPDAPFYVLGMAPNAARVAVRLWLVSTVGEIAGRMREFAAELALLPVPPDAPPMTVHRLVSETAPPASRPGYPDADRLAPGLAADVLRAVLTGGPYPAGLLAGLVARCRIEGLAESSSRRDWREAQHRRCALIRSCLLRAARARDEQKEVPVSLHPENPSAAYQLGRLFAVLERAQENALGTKINTTIKDRYFGAAMTTPSVAFPRLLRLSQHHLRGIEIGGVRVSREKELAEVMGRLTSYPRILGLEDQGLFAIGYYHQRQTYFERRAFDASADAEPAAQR